MTHYCTKQGGYCNGNRISARELEVLQLVVLGSSSKEIASVMGISEQTVKNFVSNLFRKLEVNGRVNLVVKAIQIGLANLPTKPSSISILS